MAGGSQYVPPPPRGAAAPAGTTAPTYRLPDAPRMYPPHATLEDVQARAAALLAASARGSAIDGDGGGGGLVHWILQDKRADVLYELLLPPIANALAMPTTSTSAHAGAAAAASAASRPAHALTEPDVRSPFCVLRRRAVFPVRDGGNTPYPVALTHPEVLLSRCALGEGYTPYGHDSLFAPSTASHHNSGNTRAPRGHPLRNDRNVSVAIDPNTDADTRARASTVYVLHYSSWTCSAVERVCGQLLMPLTPVSAAPDGDILNALAPRPTKGKHQRMNVVDRRDPLQRLSLKARAAAEAAASSPFAPDRLRSPPGTNSAAGGHLLYLQTPYSRTASSQRASVVRTYNRTTGVWSSNVFLPVAAGAPAAAAAGARGSAASEPAAAGLQVQVHALCDVPIWSGDEAGPFVSAADEWFGRPPPLPAATKAAEGIDIGSTTAAATGAGGSGVAALMRDTRAAALYAAVQEHARALPAVVCGLVLAYAWSGTQRRAFWLCQIVSGLHDTAQSADVAHVLHPQLPLSERRPMRRRTNDTTVVQYRGPLCLVDPDAATGAQLTVTVPLVAAAPAGAAAAAAGTKVRVTDPAYNARADATATTNAADAKSASVDTAFALRTVDVHVPYGIWHPDLAVRRPWGVINQKALGYQRLFDEPNVPPWATGGSGPKFRFPALCTSPDGAWLCWVADDVRPKPNTSGTGTAGGTANPEAHDVCVAESYVCVVHTRLCAPNETVNAVAPAAERGGQYLSDLAHNIARLRVDVERPPQPRVYHVPLPVETAAACVCWFSADSKLLYVLRTHTGGYRGALRQRRIYAVDLTALATAAVQRLPTDAQAAAPHMTVISARGVMAAPNNARTHEPYAELVCPAVPHALLKCVVTENELLPASDRYEALQRRTAALGCAQRYTGAFQVPSAPAFDGPDALRVHTLMPRRTQATQLARDAYFRHVAPLPPDVPVVVAEPMPAARRAAAAAAASSSSSSNTSSSSSSRDQKALAPGVPPPSSVGKFQDIVSGSSAAPGRIAGGFPSTTAAAAAASETPARAARRERKNSELLLVASTPAFSTSRAGGAAKSDAAAAASPSLSSAVAAAAAAVVDADAAGVVDDRALLYSLGTRRWCVVSVAHSRVWPVVVGPTVPAGAAAADANTAALPLQWWDPKRKSVRFWTVPPLPRGALL